MSDELNREHLFSIGVRETMARDSERALGMIAAGRWPQVTLIEAEDALVAARMAALVATAHYCEVQAACLTCDACQSVKAFRMPDLWWCETDDHQLKLVDVHPVADHITIKPLSDKVPRMAVLIDADKLNVHAANALLKSLEEAPASALLVLTTAKAKYMMETILSRCVRWRVHDSRQVVPPTPDLMIQQLLTAKHEGELASVAEQLMKQRGLSLTELVTMTEYALNAAYREGNVAIIGDFTRIRARREQLRRLKKWAMGHKITLNAQLSAESIVLG